MTRRSPSKKAKKNPGGRPTKYKPEYAVMAQLVIEDSGFSMLKLAKLFQVTRSTIYRWIDEEKEFSDSIRKGRKIFEGIKIHRALVKRAVGFRYTETTSEPDLLTGKLKATKKVTKFYPPDVAAIKHWQVNMDPEHWTDKRTVDIEDYKLEVVLVDPEDDTDSEGQNP